MEFTPAGMRMSTTSRFPASRPTTATSTKSIAAGAGARARRLATLKWYEIATPDAPVPADIRDLARRGLVDEVMVELSSSTALGFVILHRCGEGFYFLLASRGPATTSSGRRSGRRTAMTIPTFRPWRSRAATSRRSASGSSARSGTSSRRGAATSAPRATRTRGSSTSRTRTTATSRRGARSRRSCRDPGASARTPRRRCSPRAAGCCGAPVRRRRSAPRSRARRR